MAQCRPPIPILLILAVHACGEPHLQVQEVRLQHDTLFVERVAAYEGPAELALGTDSGSVVLTGWREQELSCDNLLPEAYRAGGSVRIVVNYLPKGGDCLPVAGWFRFLVRYPLPPGRYRITVFDVRAGETPLLTQELSIGE